MDFKKIHLKKMRNSRYLLNPTWTSLEKVHGIVNITKIMSTSIVNISMSIPMFSTNSSITSNKELLRVKGSKRSLPTQVYWKNKEKDHNVAQKHRRSKIEIKWFKNLVLKLCVINNQDKVWVRFQGKSLINLFPIKK